jgi:hypothetical protein
MSIGPFERVQSAAELAVKMHETIDFKDPDSLGRFATGLTATGEYFIGVQLQPMSEWARATWEIGPEGKVRVADDGRVLHLIYAGTPHRTEHAFGYWHVNDADEAYFRTFGELGKDHGTTCVVMRQPRQGDTDMFAWYCSCLAMLHAHVYHSGDRHEGVRGFYRAEDAAVREFNADPALRHCKACGNEHPLAYRASSELNTREEEAARAAW